MDTSSYLSLPDNMEHDANNNSSYMPGSSGTSTDVLLAQLAEAREKIRHQEATIANLLTQNNHHVRTILNQQATITHQIQSFKSLGAFGVQSSAATLDAIHSQPNSSHFEKVISNQLQTVKDLLSVHGQTGAATLVSVHGETGGAVKSSDLNHDQMIQEGGSVGSRPSNSVIDHTLNHKGNHSETTRETTTNTDCSGTDIRTGTKTKITAKPKDKSKNLDRNDGNTAVSTSSAATLVKKKLSRSSQPCSFTCNLCSKVFTHKGHFNRHLATHTGERRYICNVCNKAFAQGWHLERHKRGHTQERPFKCEVCEKPFGDISHLAAHKRIHLEEKPYKCNDCGRSFAHSNTLKTHKRIHTKEKPYHCTICEKKFTTSSQLKNHKKIHVITEDMRRRRTMRVRKMKLLKSPVKFRSREFLCVVCNEGFDLQVELTAHMSAHEEPQDI